MILFDSNPQAFSFSQGSSNVIALPDPKKGKKEFMLLVTSGKVKINSKGPVASNSAVCEAGLVTNKLIFSTKRKSIVCYFEVVGENDCTFVLSEI